MEKKAIRRLTLTLLMLILFTLTPLVLAQEVSIEWKTKASLPVPLYTQAAVFDGKIYTFGGWSVATDYVSAVYKYDPATDTWENPTSLPEPRGGCPGVAVVNDKIYVIGGSTSSPYPWSQVWEYDPIANSWTTKSSKPTVASTVGVAVLDNKIFTFGGGPTIEESNRVEVYDPSTDTWTSKSTMPWSWGSMGTAAVNGKIYLIGGMRGSPWAETDLVAEYDPATDTWSTKTPMPTARAPLASGTVAPMIDNRIYIVGGAKWSGSSFLNLVEIYDPLSDTWSTGTPMLTPRVCSSVAISNKIYAIGGYGATGHLDNNEEGTVATPTLTITMTNKGSGKTEITSTELVDEDHDGFITIDIENHILAAIKRTLGTTTFDFPGEYIATQGAWTVTLSSNNDYTVTLT